MQFDYWKQESSNNSNPNENNSQLLNYFGDANKDELSRMATELSEDAKAFFDISVNGLLGHMPEEIAETTITLNKSGLQQLLFSSMVTGYVTKSVEQKLSLEKLLNNPKSTNPLQDRLNRKSSKN